MLLVLVAVLMLVALGLGWYYWYVSRHPHPGPSPPPPPPPGPHTGLHRFVAIVSGTNPLDSSGAAFALHLPSLAASNSGIATGTPVYIRHARPGAGSAMSTVVVQSLEGFSTQVLLYQPMSGMLWLQGVPQQINQWFLANSSTSQPVEGTLQLNLV